VKKPNTIRPVALQRTIEIRLMAVEAMCPIVGGSLRFVRLDVCFQREQLVDLCEPYQLEDINETVKAVPPLAQTI
jgi:hypothetical protein